MTFLLLSNISAGWYTIYIHDAMSNDIALQVELVAPDSLIASVAMSDYNGVAISYYAASDGRIEVMGKGGTSPYSYAWASGDTSKVRDFLRAGFYAVEVKDKNGCLDRVSTTLEQPDSLVGAMVLKKKQRVFRPLLVLL